MDAEFIVLTVAADEGSAAEGGDGFFEAGWVRWFRKWETDGACIWGSFRGLERSSEAESSAEKLYVLGSNVSVFLMKKSPVLMLSRAHFLSSLLSSNSSVGTPSGSKNANISSNSKASSSIVGVIKDHVISVDF